MALHAGRRRRPALLPPPPPGREFVEARRIALRSRALSAVVVAALTLCITASTWRTTTAAVAPPTTTTTTRRFRRSASFGAAFSRGSTAGGADVDHRLRHEILRLASIRGGAAAADDDDDDSDYGWSDSSSDGQEEESEVDVASDGGGEEVSEFDAEEEEVDEDEDEDEDESSSLATGPVKLLVSTGLACPLIDQAMEVTASRTRDVASVRNTVSRQMRGRPPPSSVKLLLGSRVLRDDELIGDLVIDDDEDEDEEDDDEEDDDDGMATLKLTLDTVPPVDPKFGTELPERVQGMSTAEILDAYAANAAAMHANAAAMVEGAGEVGAAAAASADGEDVDEEEDEEDESYRPSISASALPASVAMRRHALSVRERMVSTLPEEALKVLEAGSPGSEEGEGDDELGEGDIALKESLKRRSGRRKMKGGASTHVKRVLQRNMNVNWPDTIRNSILFLFFGYFGGRDSTSRALLYLGAPLCFVLQARPVKIAAKQLFYAAGNPPGIFLSLLPAPQQAIMSLDYDGAVEGLYGSGGRTLGGDGDADAEEDSGDDSEEEEADYDDYDSDY